MLLAVFDVAELLAVQVSVRPNWVEVATSALDCCYGPQLNLVDEEVALQDTLRLVLDYGKAVTQVARPVHGGDGWCRLLCTRLVHGDVG